MKKCLLTAFLIIVSLLFIKNPLNGQAPSKEDNLKHVSDVLKSIHYRFYKSENDIIYNLVRYDSLNRIYSIAEQYWHKLYNGSPGKSFTELEYDNTNTISCVKFGDIVGKGKFDGIKNQEDIQIKIRQYTQKVDIQIINKEDYAEIVKKTYKYNYSDKNNYEIIESQTDKSIQIKTQGEKIEITETIDPQGKYRKFTNIYEGSRLKAKYFEDTNINRVDTTNILYNEEGTKIYEKEITYISDTLKEFVITELVSGDMSKYDVKNTILESKTANKPVTVTTRYNYKGEPYRQSIEGYARNVNNGTWSRWTQVQY